MIIASGAAAPPRRRSLIANQEWLSRRGLPLGDCSQSQAPAYRAGPAVKVLFGSQRRPHLDASPRRGSLATRIRPYPELIGRGFLSCVDVTYHIIVPGGGETDLTAAVLLDAGHPGATPAPLPDMQPLSGHAAIFEAPSSGGEMVARRIAGAWLVAEEAGEDGASDFQQPLSLLAHLRATVHL
jgi:hypothetical protein